MVAVQQPSVLFQSWRNNHQIRTRSFIPALTVTCAQGPGKKGHRLLHSLDVATTDRDPSSAHRLIQKFVASSSKSVALNALSHLLSSDIHSSLALPMYEMITETHWFNWNPKLISNVIASLEKQGRFDVAETLISESIQKLVNEEKQELALFYCDLIDSYSRYGLKQRVFDSYAGFKKVVSGFSSSSSSVNRRANEVMINGLCILGLPHEAEEMMKEFKFEGLRLSVSDFRRIVHGYGRLGLLNDMRRLLVEMEESGYSFDTVFSSSVISSYGAHGELSEIVSWIQKMKNSKIKISIHTYNSVLNSCPTIMSLLQDPKFLPLSMEELIEKLQKEKEEALLVKELIGSSVLVEKLEWSCLEVKLDLHGMYLGTAYLIMLQWMEELRSRFRVGNTVVPVEIRVVCGLGKHSKVFGKSPVKELVSEMMSRLKSPMKNRRRRKEDGSFVGRGITVRDWLVVIESKS